jgi:hypothetical protein
MGIRSQNNPLAAYLDVFSNTGTDAVGAAPPGAAGLTATGGVISDYTSGSDVYRSHIFTSSGTLNVTAPGSFGDTIDYLVVGGGGGGAQGSNAGGAGGAGGFRTNVTGTPHSTSALFPVSVSSYSIIIGAGGRPSYANGGSGSNSTLDNGGPNPIVSSGGGAGGTVAGIAGGSGGGGGSVANSAVYPGGASTTVTTPSPWPGPATQGFAGGTGQHIPGNWEGGGGGGGAGSVGQNAGPSHKSGSGGIGIRVTIAGPSYPIGVPGPDGSGGSQTGGWVAGGGGGYGNAQGSGGTWNGTAVQAGGPFAGGGQGAGPVSTRHGLPGTGGGGGSAGPAAALGSGGSGIVAVRYKIAELTATAKATGGAISFYGGKTIHAFTNSGTFATTSDWSAATVEYVVVGGGGAGGNYRYRGGGGGAGTYKTGTTPIGAHPVSTTITIGGGGNLNGNVQPSSSGNGSSSLFGPPITAPGGGMGGNYPNYPGIAGGSGGGGGGGPATSPAGTGSGDTFPGTIGATPPNGWGNDGGGGTDVPIGAGGGGAGAVGYPNNPSSTPTRGIGGAGIQIPASFRDPTSGVGAPGPTSAPTPNGFDTSGKYWVAGGGNAGGYGAQGNPLVTTSRPAGGGGFGGNADNPSYAGGEPAFENTGSGGGGASSTDSGKMSGSGGSGIVLIAYPS